MLNLTAEQQNFTQHRGGHAKVIAVAGAGKSTTLVEYILGMLADGANPKLMRVIMFNKDAMVSFSQKLEARAAGRYQLPAVRTFHAMGLLLYRNLVKRGYLPDFDPNPLSEGVFHLQLLKIMQAIAPETVKNELKGQKKQQWIDAAASFIDNVKADTLSAHDTFNRLRLPEDSYFFVEVFDAFETWRKNERKITFADMLYEPVKCLLTRPDAADEVANLVDFILIDEVQDINGIQSAMVTILAGFRAQVIVIGDVDQTIYEWRGSRPDYMLRDFDIDFPGATRYTLSHTFRYGHRLALAANNLISNNKEREDVVCLGAPDGRITSAHLMHTDSESATAGALIAQALADGFRPADIAVLFRVWSQSIGVELQLLTAGISYRMDGGRHALKRPEVQALKTVLQFTDGSIEHDTHADRAAKLLNLMQTCNLKIRTEIIKGAASAFADSDDSWDQFVSRLDDWPKAQLTKVRKALAQSARHHSSAIRVLNTFCIEMDYIKALKEGSLDEMGGDESSEVATAFLGFVRQQGGCSAQAMVSLLDDLLADMENTSAARADDQILLSTIHRSKGLEWPVVIIPGLSDKHYPHQTAKMLEEGRVPTPREIEAERRLLYVAMTRAIKQLHMIAPCEPQGSAAKDIGAGDNLMPSRFIREINMREVADIAEALESNAQEFTPELPLSDAAQAYLSSLTHPPAINPPKSPERPLECGDAVRHQTHGAGRIVADSPLFFTVAFANSSERILRLFCHKTLKRISDDEFTKAMQAASGNGRNSDTGMAYVERQVRAAADARSAKPLDRTLGIGEVIEHSIFGRGKVLSYRGQNVTIDFESEGLRQLSTKTLGKFISL